MKKIRTWPIEYGMGVVFGVIALISLASGIRQFVSGGTVFGILDFLVMVCTAAVCIGFFRVGRP